jgi:glutamate-1-semialdehyde 2,1-aminomutase
MDPGHYPLFARSGNGACFEDLDGRKYIDWMCSYGAMILGHARPEIENAALREIRKGDCLSLATETTVTFAEKMVKLVDGAEWCGFGKNGSDATWIAVTVARSYTQRKNVICIDGAYHGSHGWCAWCNPGTGRLENDASDIFQVPWGDHAALELMLNTHSDSTAAVIVTPFHHPIPGPAVNPPSGYLEKVTALCREYGALLIMDDVRAGFRIDLHGSHVALGGKPDLICFSKAIANGWPLAAVTGSGRIRAAAEEIFAAGTFWNAPSAMAAALETIRLLEEENAVDYMNKIGRQLANGLESAGAEYRIPLEVTGPPSMPTVTIKGNNNYAMNEFSRYMVKHGVFVHPGHNWFVSTAHTEEHVNQTLEIAYEALGYVARSNIFAEAE